MDSGAIPGTVVLNYADLQRIASLAATDAAARVNAETKLTRDDVDGAVEHGLERFCERLGLPTDKKDIDEWRKDISALRASREMREALVSHGIKAVLTVLLGGICTAIWLAVRGVR